MIPRIETDRLILRGMDRGDFPAFAALWQEPAVVRFIGGEPMAESESWGAFLRNAGSWVMDGYGQWGIFLKSGGPMLGQTGFFTPRRGFGSDFDAFPEVGWVLGGASHRRGYGSEATLAAHRWFDAQPFGAAGAAVIETGNSASLALAARLGYVPLRDAELKGKPVGLLLRRRPS